MSRVRNPAMIFSLLIPILLLTACNLPSSGGSDAVALAIAQTQIALTQTALASGDAVPQAEETQPPAEAAPTETLTPTITQTPTITLTPTSETPMVTVSRATNCRTGPGEPYDIVGDLMENEEAEVVGVSSDGGTWIIQNPDAPGECWLWGYYAEVTGPTAGLRVYDTPPTPTPAFVWEGDWTTYNFVPGDPVDTFPMTVTIDGDAFTGVITVDPAFTVTLTGTLSEDWMSVSGTWTSPVFDGIFTYYALGTDQFTGNGLREGILAAWCGSRGGAGMPDPCLQE
jgi:hypothetical protein